MNILVFVYKSIFKILCNKNLLTKRKSEKSIIQSTRTKIFSLSAFFNA